MFFESYIKIQYENKCDITKQKVLIDNTWEALQNVNIFLKVGWKYTKGVHRISQK